MFLHAMAAMVAGAFAVEFSSGTKIKGNLFGLDENGKMTLLKQQNGSADYANPNFTFNANGDNAGATLKLTTNQDASDNFQQTTQTIWFKPIDALQVTIGNYDIALNKEQIDWTESLTGLGGQGYLLQVNTAGFGLDVGFVGGTSDWFSKAKDATAALAKTFFKAGYNADFGSIGGYLALNFARNSWETGASWYGVDPKAEAGAVKQMDFGAGYKGSFGGVNVFVQAVGHMEKTFEWIRPEVYVSGNASGFGYNLFVAPLIWTNSALNKDMGMEVVAKFTYGIDAVTAYAYFKNADVMAKSFASTIKIGAQGSVSVVGWNAWLQLDTGKANNKVAISVPVEFSVNF